MRSPFGLYTALAILLIGAISQAAAKDVEIALEAELANTIVEPMVIGQPGDPKDAGGPEPPTEPSNGQFIWVPGPPTTGGGGQGYAEYIIDLPEAGKYALWGHVVAWDGNSDSFWVTWQPADPDENPQQTQNTQYRWGVAQGLDWHWDRINHWLDGGTFDREWEFDNPGETILRIWTREDATMLDAIFVTSNVKATIPEQAGVRLPTDEDRALQVGGISRAVTPQDKLATTWAKLKGR